MPPGTVISLVPCLYPSPWPHPPPVPSCSYNKGRRVVVFCECVDKTLRPNALLQLKCVVKGNGTRVSLFNSDQQVALSLGHMGWMTGTMVLCCLVPAMRSASIMGPSSVSCGER